ncbi:50S ribosomal protein L31 [Neoehrlichia mikurensis]|uniref:50S ribosomal protein L31 n=1 Tax=Neoehrlichia mikurensis TaxID=89586 RepID=A0A9Q9F3U0_9RICK|nr:50S ribosomal protein L31 [Neoehrlichia mikurensis]QXK91679.1 50S ribosomal protein L31 [Neoehrlichia mikurensis]QXK92890.1 50S ribosomal protein L31 [Neoehrlichia mikurensis]QXK93370.1 50S ribosomal protein L31 [Neoehrlichia mikurensis]UTO55685.1 50S ribosomal protein L31 [Neoehrlichia mikurensis]UTO56603.1 50S ribosomal protein L31 [Neoehrlichia mikurensis]
MKNVKVSKSERHPKAHPILVVFTDGSEQTMMSTIGTENKITKIHLETDHFNHPAWNPGLRVAGKKNSKAAKFLNRFGDLA